MGASISITTANLVVEVIEQKALADFAPKPKIFVQWEWCPTLLRLLNSPYECDGSFPLLDVLVNRTGASLCTKKWCVLDVA